MDALNTTKFILIFFPSGGILLILLALWLLAPLRGRRSVKVHADLIEVQEKDLKAGRNGEGAGYPLSIVPVYRYEYEGKTYTASPKLSSNRPGYRPVPGPCEIFIDPRKPEKVFSPERKAVAVILIVIGALWIATPAVALFLLADSILG